MHEHAYRLPHDVLPKRYDVTLEAYIHSEDFSGAVAIDLQIAQPRDTIEIHARDLQLADVRFVGADQPLSASAEIDPEREIAVLRFDQPLPAGNGTLNISFNGHLNKGLLGLYRAQDGPEQLLCTQCEATDARAIFPCFDEPEFKARFAYTITSAADATVLANTPLEAVSENAERGTKTWRFATSKPMSTYLVALVIGDVAGAPEEVVDGTPIRVWALRGKERLGAFAHTYTRRLLPWFERYFGVPYHFDKYDQVAVPGFAAGAMENSGLVLFRQSLLLMDPQTSSWDDEKWIARIVAHEFAHMWFGNLVTMKWWDDLWLNEAFAEWVAHKAVSELSPEYEVWEDFQLGKSAALRTDALESTHPIYTPVQTPAEANELFDVITYQKGSSVLRMLENFLGTDDFRAGLQTYMRAFGERNAVGADLWNHLQQASDVPVTDVMGSWITQSGYPLVAITATEAGLRVSQRRFFSSPTAAASEPQLWAVPLVIRYADDRGLHEIRALAQERETTLPLNLAGELRWCYANAGEIGFYRQQFDAPLLTTLLDHLHELAPSEQLGLLSDQWALTRSGAQEITAFLDVLNAMVQLDNYPVLREVVSHLHGLETLIQDTQNEPVLANFRSWVAATFQPKLDALGFEPRSGEDQAVMQQRVAVLDAMLALAHDATARAHAAQWADREATEPSSVDPNLAPLFVAAMARFGDAARFDRHLDLYVQRRAAGAAPQETDRYLYSFAEFRVAELVERTLSLLDDTTLPQEAIGPMLRQMLRQRHTQLQAWAYLKAHWDQIKVFGISWVSSLVEATGQLPPAQRDDLVAFMDVHAKGVADKSYARALETMDQLAEFMLRVREDLLDWFARPVAPNE